jgi:glutaconate CoA-transferase subunit A
MSKITDIARAAALVRDGDIVAIGGQTLYRRPVATARELARQGRRGLTVTGLTAGFETDLLLAAGCVSVVRSAYTGFDFLGLAPHFGKDHTVCIVEETEASIIQGVKAALAHVGFMPFRGTLQTDIMKVRPDLKTVQCPYSGETLVAWPAIRPDVALIHTQRADRDGNAVIASNPSIDRLWAAAAATTIVTAEEIVEPGEIEGGAATILGRSVAAVVHVPGGAHPTGCYPMYRVDVPYLLEYVDACRKGSVPDWLADSLRRDHIEHTRRFVNDPSRLVRMPQAGA